MKKILLLILTASMFSILFTSCTKDNSITPIVVNAGLFKTVQLPSDSATLVGTVISGQSSISTYSWTYIAGSNTPVITNNNSTTAKVTNLVSGTYIFQFEATNSNGTVVGLDTTGIVVFAKAPPSPLTATQILASHTWEAGETFQDLGGIVYHYLRGGENTFPNGNDQGLIRYTFNADGTGTYRQYTNSSITWRRQRLRSALPMVTIADRGTSTRI